MANQRREGVSYRTFRAQPNLAEGLLGVSREGGGDLERRIAAGLARMADSFGQKADRQAAIAGERAGRRDAMAGMPGQMTVDGGEAGTASVNGQAGHVAGARGGVRVSPREANEAAEQARSYLMQQHGLSAAQANAFVGHGMQESAFNTRAVGDNGSAFGIMQWRGDRQTGLRRFAAQSGRPADDLKVQLDWAVNELKTSEKSAGEKFFGSSDVRSAVTALMDYERPAGWTPQNPTAGHGFANRLAYALGQPETSGGSYTAMPEPSSVGPVTVTPVDRPVTMTAGKAGGFKPSGSDTIYGRSYDVAGTRTYREELELTMMADQDAVFEAYKDDPAGLEKAYNELLTAHRKDHVFEEIDADYSLAFRKRAMGKIGQAKSLAEEKRQVADRSDFIGRVQEFENTKSRLLAGFDGNSDAAETELAALQGTIDQHYDSAVARGIITADDAARAKKAGRSDLMTTFYTRQASTKTAAEIRTMREEMTRDYAEGKLEGVDADDWDRISGGLAAAEKARVTQDEKSNADLTKRGEDMAKRLARGLPVSADELARFQLDAKTAPDGAQIVGSTLSRLKVSEAVRTLPIGEVEKKLPSLLGDKATPEDLDFARKTVAEHRKALASDPIGVAERFGILPPSPALPLDGDVDPAAISSAFSERVNQADAAARHFGVTPKYFRPGEAETIEAAVKADPERGLSIAAGLVDAADRNSPRLLAELGETAPALSGAGEIIAVGGDMAAARDLMAGYGKTPDGRAYPDMEPKKRMPEAEKIAAPALAYSPDQVKRLDAQAAAIARKRLYDAGIDPKSDDAKPVYARALNEAAGASFVGGVQYGGFGTYDAGMFYRERPVLVSPSIRADRFSDVVGAITDADLGGLKAKNGRAWTAADLQKAVPVAVKGGYVFAQGDPQSANPMFVADDKGNPLLLDLANMARLKARVPEAYR
jgi:hypothetical protein